MGFKIIYEPKGRAKEYAGLALNIFTGCDFGCKYCYAPQVLKKDRENYHEQIKIRDNLLEKVEKDCQMNLFENRPVLLCFTCDPYQREEANTQVTREVLKLFKKYNVNFKVLTKAGMVAERDFDLYKPGDSFGCTLTFVNAWESVQWEPRAALPISRIHVIKEAHYAGIKTFVSLEPVIIPEQAYTLIELTSKFVDLYKVGKINYNKEIEDKVDWKQFANRVVMLFKELGKKYYIKDDLKKYMEEVEA